MNAYPKGYATGHAIRQVPKTVSNALKATVTTVTSFFKGTLAGLKTPTTKTPEN